MEDVCERMMDIAARRGEKESLSQKVMRNLSQRLHDDEFWSEAVVVSWEDVVAEKVVDECEWEGARSQVTTLPIL